MAAALAGLRVLDLSRVLAGPWCTQTLADLGAEVIKIERPDGGDDTRAWGPPTLRDAHGRATTESAYYLCANRGKRSVAVDFTTPQGQAIVRTLACASDVVIENFRVGQLAKYGLDWASLHALKPDLIYCSITGFGQTGPYAQRAGYDFVVQAMGGFMSITGEPDDRPGGGPQKAGVAVSDLATGLYATVAILAALRHRDRTGEGQHLDVALLDTTVALLANLGSNYLCTGVAPTRVGNAHPNIVPYQTFETLDGRIVVAVGNDTQYAKFCEIGGCPDLARAPYATNPDRVRARASLVPQLAAMVRTRPSAFWIERLDAAGVPCGPINDLDAVFDDPQVVARGLERRLEHPVAGTVPTVANPIRMSATDTTSLMAPPMLGADTRAVLETLGIDAATIDGLAAQGVVRLS